MRVCLIHGSTQSPHGWDLLVKELMAWGVEVTAVDLPVVSKGAAFFAEEVARQMPQGEPPVVVAHSMAGLVLPVVPEFMKVAGLVYLAAVVPTPNVSLLEQYQEAKEMFQPDWPSQDPTANPESAERFLFHDSTSTLCSAKRLQLDDSTQREGFDREYVVTRFLPIM